MTEDVPPGRTTLQKTLLTSDAAWQWFLLGYEHGVRDGHDIGAQWIVDQIKDAGRELVKVMRDVADYKKAVAARYGEPLLPDTKRGEW